VWRRSNVVEQWEISGNRGAACQLSRKGEMPVKGRLTMNRTLRNETVALVLAGGALLAAAPANANAVDNEGYFGGSWSSIGPSNYYQRRHAGRVGPLYSHRVYREYGAAPYAYYGGPAYYSPYYYSYGYGPPLIDGPGIGFSIGID
jgi:hypothetical protein